MQVSEWPYCSNKSLPPLISCSKYGFVATASFNLLTIYKNTENGLKPISSSKSFEKAITTISWCNFYDSESMLPLCLLVGFDNGRSVLFDIPKFSIISHKVLSESAITSSEWSNLYSNHFFVGCQNGDLISAYFVKSTENNTDFSIVASHITSCAFPIEQLHTNHNDRQMLMVASNHGKFAIYDQIYDESPMRLFTGSFEENEDLPLNQSAAQNPSSLSNNNASAPLNTHITASSSLFFDVNNLKCFIQCGFHPHVNDIFYFATRSRIYYGFIKEQTTVSLFPSSSFDRLVGVFFPPSDENAIIVIQRSSVLLLSYTIEKNWKRICTIPNIMPGAVSFADCKFEKNSFVVASKGNNLSIIKFYRRRLFHVTFMRNLVSKPSKIAINNSFYAFIVKNPKIHSVGPKKDNFFLYLAPQLTCMTSFCLVYNINLNHNYKRNYCSQSNSISLSDSTNDIISVTQIEWISDTDLIFAARCEGSKHKLFFFNYERRELISILKPQLEFIFLDKQQMDSRSIGSKTISMSNSKNSINDNQNNNPDNSNINLFESIMEEVGINTSSNSNISLNSNSSQSILVSSTYNFSPTNFLNPAYSSYYSTLINNDLSIRLHAHRNQNFFVATVGNSTLEFFVTSQSNTPNPLLFENSSVVILPEPAAISFVDDSHDQNKLTIFYKNHIDICCISTLTSTTSSPSSTPSSPKSQSSSRSKASISFELLNSYEYHSELKSIPMLAHSFSETFHILVLENGEIDIVKIKSYTSNNRRSSFRETRKMSTDSIDNDNINSRKMSVDSSVDVSETSENKEIDITEESIAFIEVLGRMQKVTCLRVASDGSTCMIIGKQSHAENVAFVTLSNTGKSKISFPKEKLRVKRCDYVSNSIILTNVLNSRCFTFCNIDDRNPIDTPHHEIKIPFEPFESLKSAIVKELSEKKSKIRIDETAASRFTVFSSYLSYDAPTPSSNENFMVTSMKNSDSFTSFSSSFGSTTTSAFTTNEEIDFSSSSDEIEPVEQDDTSSTDTNTKIIKKPIKKDDEDEDDYSEYEDEDESEQQKNRIQKQTAKIGKNPSQNLKMKKELSSNISSDLESSSNSVIISSKMDFSSASASLLSSPVKQVNSTLVDISFVSHLAEKMGLFYISDLLQSVTQKYDPLCYGINLNDNYLVYYLRSYSEMLGESQPQPLNRRQAIYQKLANDNDGTLSRLLTVGQNEQSNHTKNMLKIALSTLQLNEENFQMMLDVLLESGFDEDATDILFFSGKYNYRSVERFVTSGELEFAVIATRLLLKPNELDSIEIKNRKEKETDKAVSLIVNFFTEHKRKQQIVPFLLGMRRFEEAAKYLDDYGEHKCATIIRSLVVSDKNNFSGNVWLDYSKLPSS